MKNSLTKKLLLAVITLGIAVIATVGSTYAWFSMNTTVEATGMQLTATTPVNVVISDELNGTYTNSVAFDTAVASMYPSSTDKSLLTSSGFTFWAVDEGQVIGSNGIGGPAEADTTFKTTAITTADADAQGKRYLIAEDIYLKTTAGKVSLILEEIMLGDVDDAGLFSSHGGPVSSTAVESGATYKIADALYVALLTDHGTFMYSANGSQASITGIVNVVESAGEFYEYEKGDATTLNVVNDTTSTNLVFDSATAGSELGTTAEKVTVLVWLEGEDPECINAIGGLGISVGLKFKYVNDSYLPEE